MAGGHRGTVRGPSAWGGDGSGGGSGAPTDAPYVTTSANATLSNETLIGAIILPPDVLANRPAAGATVAGSIFFATDAGTLTRSTGAAWEAYSAASGGALNLATVYAFTG